MPILETYNTYLINLDRSKDRLNYMTTEFKKCEISFERISAIDGKNVNKSEFKTKNKYIRNLIPGEIGCYLSHIKVMKKFLESDKKFAVIFEDDAIFDSNLKSIIEKAIIDYSNLDKQNKWDVLKLINENRRHIKIKDLDNKYFIASCGTSIPITTLGAIWTREGVQKFLSKIINPIPIINRPIDCDLQFPWEFNLIIYNLLPSPIRVKPLNSEIQLDNNYGGKSSILARIRYEILRIFPKYSYLIKRHGFNNFYNSFIIKNNKKIP